MLFLLTLKKILTVLIYAAFLFAQNDENSFIKKGDDAFLNFDNARALENYDEAVKINPQSYEANWKLSRAYVDVGETFDDEDKRAEYYKESEKYARESINSNSEGSNGHLYLSIALGRVALDAGAKQRIKMSKEIKKEVDLAIKYDPENDIAYHVLGRWNRKISNLSFIEKGFADLFLGGVPKGASNEAAIQNFQKAIELNPKYINHYLELGITYEMMDKDDLAIAAFKKCLELELSSAKDKTHKEVAKEHLDDLM
jgi:tetratricopeptide (TPR) repeat protein